MVLSQGTIDELARKGAERGLDLRPGLELVEKELRAQASSDVSFVDAAARYLVDAGGKRFRPMLVLLCGMLGGSDATDRRLVDAGVIVELVHIASLYHDDLIDGADVRRGAPASHVRWSNTVAVLTGDYLLARASELSAALGVEVTRIMAATIASLCQGQIRELAASAEAERHGAERLTPTRGHYLAVIAEKTASLIASSCRLGAVLSGQSSDAVEALGTFGWRLGMAFQQADDLLDVVGDATVAGKRAGSDLRQGVWTLPVLLALETDGPHSRLAALLDQPDREDEALSILRGHPALELARDAAMAEASHAKRALEQLDPPRSTTPALDALAWLADYAADRVR
jgi:heptaprenyl diphosphate synthase